MSTQDLTLLSALATKMGWLENRQKVLAQNIANANTPGYHPEDLAPLDFKNLLKNSASAVSIGGMSGGAAGAGLQMAMTDEGQSVSGGASSSGDKAMVKKEKMPYEVKPDGNAVDLEEQLVKMNQNFADHSFITNLYQKNIDMLKEVVK
ncbi:MAG: flagellar basal body rod protein FlgB [Alphaproteobacteria bacterium]|nr:flagellar basal body rod protein FlgB [Alphaproteobacteria bacterium]